MLSFFNLTQSCFRTVQKFSNSAKRLNVLAQLFQNGATKNNLKLKTEEVLKYTKIEIN